MNRQLGFLAAVLFSTLLVACGAPSPRTITDQDAGKTIEVSQGEKINVLLEGNPTTGYTWELDPQGISILKQIGEPEFTPESGGVGSGGKVSLTFEAVAAGQAPLKLIYHRPFETDQPPVQTFEVTVVVK